MQKKNKICNYATGRCIKDKNVENVYKINKYRHRQKMAIFDYDWTLVKPKLKKDKRSEYIAVAKKYNIEARCINVKTDIVESMFRNNKRDKVIPKITYYIFRKKYQEPTIDEGFKEVI